MSLFHDIKYLQLISPLLLKFKRKSDNLWNFRCPICSDSKKNQNKCRGYVYKEKSDLFYKCHNCGISLSFGNFIKHVDPSLYDEYVFERYSHGESSNKPHTKPNFPLLEKQEKKKVLDIPTLNSLEEKHPAVQYIKNRKIPQEFLDIFYYVDHFEKFANKITSGEYELKQKDNFSDPRIVIPFLDMSGNLIAFQGRSLLPSSIRYITVKLNENFPKIFGLDRWKKDKITYVTEGPFDSLFLPNGLAMAGSSVDLSILNLNKKNTVFVFDNEKRNKQIIDLMLKRIEEGYGIVIWDEKNNKKDINDMILSGRSKDNVLAEIQSRTKFGLEATLEISRWRKC